MVEGKNCGNKSFFLDGMSPKTGALLATTIAEILADGLSATQINIFAAFATSVADSIAYIAAQLEANNQKAADKPFCL